MSRVFTWKQYEVEITKKKVKRINIRIKPSEPRKIHMSIPYQVTYDEAMKLLDQPRNLEFIENYEKKLKETPVQPRNWYDEHIEYISEYSKRLEKLLPEMFEKWQKILNVRVSKVNIKDTRSQWGSCNRKTHNISISVWLGAFSEDCIESVVVHELVHFLERGHNARFYGYMDKYYPNWRECSKKLKAMQTEEKNK